MIIPVAVEKLAHFDFAKIASRQEALQTIFPSLLDIFYHPTFDFFQKNRLFQQPPLFSTVIRKSALRLVILADYFRVALHVRKRSQRTALGYNPSTFSLPFAKGDGHECHRAAHGRYAAESR
jgi:hypothetical protein